MAEKNIGCRPLKGRPSLELAGHLGRQKAIQGRRPLWPAYIVHRRSLMAGLHVGRRPSFIRIPSYSFAYIWVLGRFVKDP